jgi:AraC-like DNA-binding protein/ligand-binding sensor protein
MNDQVNFIFREEIRKIFECFTLLFKIKITFFSFDSKELIAGGPLCKYCSLLRNKLNFELICQKLDYEKQQQTFANKQLLTYTCHGGMIEAILPVLIADKPIGYIMIGQFRIYNQMPVEIRRQWQAAFGNDLLYRAFLQAPRYSVSKTKNILVLFSLLVDLIASKHLIMTSSTLPISKLVSYIDEHPEANISISNAANMLNCSVSYLTHHFRNATGQSFKEYTIQRKLAKADELLNSDKTLKIYEIAKAVGYSDPFMFSRIYKKYRLHPPSKGQKKSI